MSFHCCLLGRVLPSFVAERDLDSAGGFDFTLGRCRRCGTPWLSVWCTASSMPGYERISREDVETIAATRDPQELKQFMKAWARKHL